MNTCPCCSDLLLPHIRSGRIYYYCQHCHQEMPNLDSILAINLQKALKNYGFNLFREDPIPKVTNQAF